MGHNAPHTENIEAKLIAIVTEMLTDMRGVYRQKNITLDLSLQKHLGFDSISLAELFSRIEKTFNIQLPSHFFSEADTLSSVVEIIHNSISKEKSAIQYLKNHVSTEDNSKKQVDISTAHTLVEALLLHAKSNPEKLHINLINDDDEEELITYGKLLDNSLRFASALCVRGLRNEETVAIMLTTSPEFFYTFFGVLLAGGVPVPIYPPLRLNQIEAYLKQEAAILKSAETRFLVTFKKAKKVCQILKTYVSHLKHIISVDELFRAEPLQDYDIPSINDLALIQYTSGSTGVPKGVMLTHHNLISNIRSYGSSIGVNSNDVVASWLPLYHDLGLIGNWLGSLYFGVLLVAMSPLAFLTRPEKWLWTIHYHRCSIVSGPNFAYELCVRKVDPVTIEGLDLSSIRIAINGAEPIYSKTLFGFAEKFKPYGFKLEKFLPVYGLAESSLGLTTSPVGRAPRIDRLNKTIFENEHRAEPLTDPDSNDVIEFISCGFPMTEQEVRIVNSDNEELPERHVGQLQFRGTSSMQGYLNNPTTTNSIFHDGWWDSGDFAYQADGEIFITGRKKDIILKAGRNLYPADIEKVVSSVKGIRAGCVAAFGVTDLTLGTDKLVIAAETNVKQKSFHADIKSEIFNMVNSHLDISPDDVVLLPPQTIPKTSSGKLQRNECKKRYLQNKLFKKPFFSRMQLFKVAMLASTNRLKRLVYTTGKIVYTAYFSLISIVTFFPIWILINVLSRDHAAIVCKYWAKALRFICLCPTKIIGQKNLSKASPTIFLSNHTSYLDVGWLAGVLPANTVFVGKKELFDMPILSTFLKKMGHISIDKNDVSQGAEDTKQIEQVLMKGYSVLIFPEGTFGYATGLRPFRLGAFKLALETKIPLCPIAIKGVRNILRDEEYLLAPHPVQIKVGELVYPEAESTLHNIINLKNKIREEIAKNCGEASLDLIIPGISAKKVP